jgi:hypothetical protein
MAVILLAIACAPHVSWQYQPAATYALPAAEVAVVADDRRCGPVADELVKALRARPGVEVRPGAEVKLVVTACDAEVHTTLEQESNYLGLGYPDTVVQERQRYTQRGTGRAMLLVTGTGQPTTTLRANAERDLRGGWVSDGSLDVPATMELQDRLDRELGWQLADMILPLPETVRRVVYRDPEPGTSRALHNEAVAAERHGKLDEAMRLARAAYAADPTQRSRDYMLALEQHASRVGYALKAE